MPPAWPSGWSRAEYEELLVRLREDRIHLAADLLAGHIKGGDGERPRDQVSVDLLKLDVRSAVEMIVEAGELGSAIYAMRPIETSHAPEPTIDFASENDGSADTEGHD